jgi:hypothetical protein
MLSVLSFESHGDFGIDSGKRLRWFRFDACAKIVQYLSGLRPEQQPSSTWWVRETWIL